MHLKRFLPILVAAFLAVSVVYLDMNLLPKASGAANVTLHVAYPDTLDESTVTDQLAFQMLAAEGIHVTPTYYSYAPLAYESLISGQQDIVYDESAGPYGIGGVQQQTTCVGGYQLAGSFIAIAGGGITSPSQLIGKTAEDSGPGTVSRFLNEYWFKEAGIQINENTQESGSVFLKAGLEDYNLVSDLEKGVVREIVVDSFILFDLQGPSVNNTADGGPFHVIFYSPDNILDTCYVVRDSWLTNPSNQQVLVEFLAAIYQAQRIFISNPAAFVPYAQRFLPYSPLRELENASVSYPANFTYWPYGEYNLQGDQNVSLKFQNTIQFFMEAGVLSSPVQNDSVKPYGIVNKYFELKALQSLGPYDYPDEPWVNANFTSDIHSWVPSWMGG